MAIKASPKVNKEDHAGMKKAAKVAKGFVTLGGFILSIYLSSKGISKPTKKT